MCAFTVALQFNSHKSVQELFHNLHIFFSNSLNVFKVTCQLEKEPLKGLASGQEIFFKTISLVKTYSKGVKNIYPVHIF